MSWGDEGEGQRHALAGPDNHAATWFPGSGRWVGTWSLRYRDVIANRDTSRKE